MFDYHHNFSKRCLTLEKYLNSVLLCYTIYTPTITSELSTDYTNKKEHSFMCVPNHESLNCMDCALFSNFQKSVKMKLSYFHLNKKTMPASYVSMDIGSIYV